MNLLQPFQPERVSPERVSNSTFAIESRSSCGSRLKWWSGCPERVSKNSGRVSNSTFAIFDRLPLASLWEGTSFFPLRRPKWRKSSQRICAPERVSKNSREGVKELERRDSARHAREGGQRIRATRPGTTRRERVSKSSSDATRHDTRREGEGREGS
jgi:hypothetical protein